MTLKNAASKMWRYLRNSHGTHDGWEGDGYGGSVPVTIPNKTPLEKIAGAGLVLLVLAVGGLAIKCCSDEEAMKRERAIPHPFYAKMAIDYRESNIKSLKGTNHPKAREFYEREIKAGETQIQQTARTIREKVEKGYLKPGDMYWKDYEKIFGNETWWQEAEKKGKAGK